MRRTTQLPDPNGSQLVPRCDHAEPRYLERERGYYGDDADEPGAGGLFEYWRILRRRIGVLILITFFGGLLALLITIPQTPIYRATTTVEIQQMNPEFMNMNQVSPVRQTADYWDNSDILTQIEIIESDSMIARVLAKLALDRPGQLSTDTDRVTAWRRALNLPEPEVTDAWQEAIEMAADTLLVRSSGQTRIVEIAVDSTEPELASSFVNTLAEEFIDQNLESRWQMTQRTGDWLKGQLEELRIKLERSEDELQRYATRAGLMYRHEEINVAEEKLRRIQESLSDARAERIAKQSRFETVRTSPPESLPDVLSDASLREYQMKITNLQQQAAELGTTFTPEHISVKRVEAQITTLKAALMRERGAIIRRIENEFMEAQHRESLLEADYRRQTQLVSDQSARGIRYSILKREVDSNRELYETMLERLKEASVATALRASNVRVVDRASIPEVPYKPRVILNTMLGFMLGGFFAVVFVILSERADRSLQEPGDIGFYLSLPELGVIPAAERTGRKLVIYRAKEKLQEGAEEPKHSGNTTEPDGVDAVELVTWKKKPSWLAESFRAALTSILFSGQNGSRPQVLTFSSADPGEGKTTVTSNLAIALAEVNQKVLLVDGDLRKPRLHEIFEIEQKHGLAEALRDRRPLGPDSLNGSIRDTAVENLFLLPSGESSASVTNLLYSERMSLLLRTFEQVFDMILIDTPPMTHIPDARILGRMSDAVILIIRAGKTTRDTALAASQRFAEDGTKVLGAVLNYWEPKKGGAGRYRYSDRYSYHYYQPYG